jgi:Spy/CpxP family protein refolding chaperone
MVLNLRMGLIIAVLVAAVALVMGSSFAHAASGGTRPGWGYGDKNHVHTGPPGQSVSVHNH